MHFRISSSFSFQWKTKHHVFLLLFVLTPVYLNWPSYATWKCNQSPRPLISTMKHCWLYISINFLTIFQWKMRNSRLNLIYLSYFVQYISWRSYHVFPYQNLICYFSIWWKEHHQQLITYYKLIELFLVDFLINLRKNCHFWCCSISNYSVGISYIYLENSVFFFYFGFDIKNDTRLYSYTSRYIFHIKSAIIY